MWAEEIVAGRPAWRHTPSGVVFREVPAGTFRMGMTGAELSAVREIGARGEADDDLEPFLGTARQWQPVRQVTVGSFLIARHPLTVAQVRHWLPEREDDHAGTDTTAARLEDELEDLLGELPFRLPSEAEWEYAARAGTTTLTFRGDHRPGEEQVPDDLGDEARTAAAGRVAGARDIDGTCPRTGQPGPRRWSTLSMAAARGVVVTGDDATEDAPSCAADAAARCRRPRAGSFRPVPRCGPSWGRPSMSLIVGALR